MSGDEQLWWLSYCDPDAPKDGEFLGVVIVEAHDFICACFKSRALGISPGGEVLGGQVCDIPEKYRDRLLSRAEIEAAGLA